MAIGSVSAVAAALALVGVLDTSIVVAALLCLAVRASAAALGDRPLALTRAASAALPLAALASVAAWRAGSSSLDAIRGANAILGAAAVTAPASFAVATVVAAAAVVVLASSQTVAATPSWEAGVVSDRPQFAGDRLVLALDRAGLLLVVLLVTTAIGGPDVDGARSILAWTVGALLVGLAVRAIEPIARHRRVVVAAEVLAAIAVVIGVMR